MFEWVCWVVVVVGILFVFGVVVCVIGLVLVEVEVIGFVCVV